MARERSVVRSKTATKQRVFPGPAPMVAPWPKGIRCVCLFTYDVDVDSGWVRRGITDPVTLSMTHFEPKVAIPCILSFLDYFDIKSTFFVPAWVAEKYTPMAKSIVRAGHNIGHHGYMHEPGSVFKSPEEEDETIGRAIETLDRLLGVKPRGYRSPSLDFSTQTARILEKHGLEYTSDMMDTLLPEYYEFDGQQSRMMNLPIHWNLDDLAHFAYHIQARKTILSSQQALDIYLEEFHGVYAYGGMFVLVMHPYASGRPSRLLMMKKFLTYLTKMSDVWIASPEEIVDYWRATYPQGLTGEQTTLVKGG